jgi:hypothetical protein
LLRSNGRRQPTVGSEEEEEEDLAMDRVRLLRKRRLSGEVAGSLELERLVDGRYRAVWRPDDNSGSWIIRSELRDVDATDPVSLDDALDEVEVIVRAGRYQGSDGRR